VGPQRRGTQKKTSLIDGGAQDYTNFMKVYLILVLSAAMCVMAKADGTNHIKGATENTNQLTTHIEGAFGFKLGDSVDRANLESALKNSTFELFIAPPVTNAEFTSYGVFVTPKTGRIFKIMAAAVRKSYPQWALRDHNEAGLSDDERTRLESEQEAVDHEFLGICEMIRKKYTPNQEPPAKSDEVFLVGSVEFNPAGIRRIEVIRPDKRTIAVIYEDLGLAAQARREEAEISASHKDSSGL
jgi:hypothetical protein